MNPLVVTYATHENDKGLHALVASLKHYLWAFEVLGIGEQWKGFGCKLIAVRDSVGKWQKQGYTHIIFVDAYDVVCTRYSCDFLDTFKNQPIVYSGELNCWPDANRADDYTKPAHYPWKYVNSGSYLLDITPANTKLNDIFEGVEVWHDDQRHMTSVLLDKGIGEVDNDCQVFQSIAFCHPWQEWFDIHGEKLYNKKTNTYPYFIHGNGKTDMSWLPKLKGERNDS